MFRSPFEVEDSISVSSFAELHSALSGLHGHNENLLFRGQRKDSSTWALLPKAYRPQYRPTQGSVEQPYRRDETFLNEWFKENAGFLNPYPHDVWMRIAIAQHNGLPTRLMDWSSNPLVAAYFAVSNATENDDPVIYAYQYDGLLETSRFGPYRTGDGVYTLTAFKVDDRIVRQSGYFTIFTPICGVTESVTEIKISSGYCAQLKDELSLYGISHHTLFPSLEAQTQSLSRRIQCSMS